MEGSQIYGIKKQDRATKIKVSHVVPLLKLIANRGNPTGLGYKINYQVGTREKEYNPSPFFPPNPPTSPCPSVPKKSKHKLNCTMKSHTLGVGRPTFKYMIITDEQGYIMASSCGEETWHIKLSSGCKLPTEDISRRKKLTQESPIGGGQQSESEASFSVANDENFLRQVV